MSKLIFKAEDVHRVVKHALESQRHMPRVTGFDAKGGTTTTVPGKSALLLVHDSGVYLMSNGEPRDIVERLRELPDRPETRNKGRSFVAYAEGCDPKKNPHDWVDMARVLVGGDDFSETLPWAHEIRQMLVDGASEIVIDFGTDQCSLSAMYPKREPAIADAQDKSYGFHR